MTISRLSVAALALVAATSAHALEPKASVYTRHSYQKCPERKSSEPGVTEIRACLGVGTSVIWVADADGAVVGFGRPTKESLGLAPFTEVGETIEWRSTKTSNGAPVAAIVRYRIGQRIGALNQTRLVVYRLEPGGRSCVMAAVKEPGANAKARAIADDKAEAFRCGASKRIE